MIVVSLKRSYPNLVDDVRQGTEPAATYRLEGITRGDWLKISPDLLDGYLDYVVGTYDDMIVSAYPIERVEARSGGLIRFLGEEEVVGYTEMVDALWSSGRSSAPGEWLIGCPMPGGPWKRGEGRGTRRYQLKTYLEDNPQLTDRRHEDFGGRMQDKLLRYYALGEPLDMQDYPSLHDAGPVSSETGVTVVRQPGGTVVVTIPTGTRAQVIIDPATP